LTPSVGMGQIEIFGTYHVDRPNKVEQELRDFSEEAEIFFVEQPQDPANVEDWASLLNRNPAMFIAGWILNLFWAIPGFLLTRQFDSVDSYVTRQVAQERNLDIDPVDLNLVPYLSNIWMVWTAISWMWAIFVLATLAFGVALSPKILLVYGFPLTPVFIFSTGILFGFLPIVAFARLSLPKRDGVIAQNIHEDLESMEEIDHGCLVVGRKHIEGVSDELEDRGIMVAKTHDPKFLRRSL
jgi:hypothetical protein